MINDYNTLRPFISNWIHGEMHCISNSVLEEVHLSSNGKDLKPYTINRIKNLISKHNLELKVWEDDTMLNSDRFIISKQ